jgi:hypothetical protein
MTKPTKKDKDFAAQMRTVSIVVAAAGSLWIGMQWLGRDLNWDVRYVFLFDFAALAAFGWALVVIYRIWQRSRKN